MEMSDTESDNATSMIQDFVFLCGKFTGVCFAYMPYLTLWDKLSQNFGPSRPRFP